MDDTSNIEISKLQQMILNKNNPMLLKKEKKCYYNLFDKYKDNISKDNISKSSKSTPTSFSYRDKIFENNMQMVLMIILLIYFISVPLIITMF